MGPVYAMTMKMTLRIAIACATGLFMTGAFASSPDVFAQGRNPSSPGPKGEQDDARRAMLDGRVMPFSVIKRRMEREMGDATYLGSEFHRQSNRYRLKYVRDGRVVWVDVDGRTGDIAGMAH